MVLRKSQLSYVKAKCYLWFIYILQFIYLHFIFYLTIVTSLQAAYAINFRLALLLNLELPSIKESIPLRSLHHHNRSCTDKALLGFYPIISVSLHVRVQNIGRGVPSPCQGGNHREELSPCICCRRRTHITVKDYRGQVLISMSEFDVGIAYPMRWVLFHNWKKRILCWDLWIFSISV